MAGIITALHLNMQKLPLKTGYFALLIFAFSCLCQLFNQYYTHFQGISYVPKSSLLLTIILALMTQGAVLLTSKKSTLTKLLLRLTLVYFCVGLLVFLTESIQLTPFKPIDAWLITIDDWLLFDTTSTLNWVHQSRPLVWLLANAYAFLNIELGLMFLSLILIDDTERLIKVLYLLLSTASVGFIFYYFFPTVAPASMLTNPHFYKEQYDTGLKFYQIHQYLPTTTKEGGMIALPSYHCLWALLCQYASYQWRWLFRLLFPINALIILACVLLGWHYLIDILAAIAIFAYFCRHVRGDLI